MKKKKIIIILFILLITLICLLIFTGRPLTSVYLKDFELSKDNKTIILKVETSDSMNYIRKIKKNGGSTDGYYTFYSTYGINSKFGAKDTFEIKIDENVNDIYFYSGNKGYNLVLTKNPITKEFVKIKYPITKPLKLELPQKEDILKVSINDYSQNINYSEYEDKEIIDKIYNIFAALETSKVSTTYNPDISIGNTGYMISFYQDLDNLNEYSYVEIYTKKGKYYAEQRYNGIYEITENDFNLIKNYIK